MGAGDAETAAMRINIIALAPTRSLIQLTKGERGHKKERECLGGARVHLDFKECERADGIFYCRYMGRSGEM